jgi:hypothetical protein
MTIKKTLILVGSIMVLGAGFIMAGENPRVQDQNAVQERVASRNQTRALFVDENGDGICDYARDHDNDGIPNCQDPDWTRPENGTGFKKRNGQNSYENQIKNRKGYHGGNTWNTQSFRQNKANFGGGICDGIGPKGKGRRGGRG